MNANIPVQHNLAEHRFEATVDGLLCVCDYRLSNGVATFTHTEVPPALGGRGIAAALVGAALDWSKQENLKVLPACSYVAAYIRRHPQYQDLMARN